MCVPVKEMPIGTVLGPDPDAEPGHIKFIVKGLHEWHTVTRAADDAEEASIEAHELSYEVCCHTPLSEMLNALGFTTEKAERRLADTGRKALKKDGKTVFTGNSGDVWMWLRDEGLLINRFHRGERAK